jgi:DNA-binding FrmR family transcriptional regulator
MRTESQHEILHRLRTAEGHLRAALEMAEAGRPCEQVLEQLTAIQSALRATSINLIHTQIRESRVIISESACVEERVAEMKRVQSLFSLFTKQAHRAVEVTNE